MGSAIKILVTGGNGQLAQELKELQYLHSDAVFLFISRDEVSITNTEKVDHLFQNFKPQFLINCAAYTAVDKAETEKDEAIAVNATAVGKLASLCKSYNCKFLHVSTDYVFDGSTKKPLKESDEVAPVNFYGETKLQGERLALENNPESIIIRTSWLYSYFGKNFVKTMIRLMNEKNEISVVNDQVGSPTNATDLAETILKIIFSGKWIGGIYHFSNEGVISWFDFATEIKKEINTNCKVNPIPTQNFPTPAKRPSYSVLDKEKIKSTFNIELQHWTKSLKKCIDKFNDNSIFQ